MGEQVEMTTPSKLAIRQPTGPGQVHSVGLQSQVYAGLGAAITAELRIGFWFGVRGYVSSWGSR